MMITTISALYAHLQWHTSGGGVLPTVSRQRCFDGNGEVWATSQDRSVGEGAMRQAIAKDMLICVGTDMADAPAVYRLNPDYKPRAAKVRRSSAHSV